jgi:hypothetical protein
VTASDRSDTNDCSSIVVVDACKFEILLNESEKRDDNNRAAANLTDKYQRVSTTF